MVVWLVGLVGGFKMPLPSTCPMDFASMPEHFVEDAMELLIFASRIPKALDGVVLVDFHSKRLFFWFFVFSLTNSSAYALYHIYILVLQDEFMNFIIMFMASPNFIKNPYLRAKMVEVLNCWMPRRR